MAFILSLSQTYEWPLSLEVPVNNKRRKFTFTAIFRRLAQSRIDEIMIAQQDLRAMGLAGASGPEFAVKFREVRCHAAEVLAGWKELKANDGDLEDLPATEENIIAVLEVPGMADAVMEAYAASIVEAKRGN